MNRLTTFLTVFITLILWTETATAQQSTARAALSDTTFAGLKLRSIGPALMAGRIADIAIDPSDYSTWYVAVGSGGVWKTKNAGTTWTPIFDDEASYSIGCVTIDPSNSQTIWVGTGENVGGRHVGFGDGVYRSVDGGKSWENLGLKGSEHISKIIVHPDNSDKVWVVAQGPLWSKGGERGVYKTTDGGASWTRMLGDDEWVGATDLLIDPRNPDRLYAATWQRHRTVAAYLGGGPGTAIYRSDDGGVTWEKLSRGLPTSNMGKIGLALSPQNPDVIYAAIELDRRTGGVYRSADGGSTWEKRSDAVAGATGPHYYQELYASPHQFDLIYLMDTVTQVSDDGGTTFRRLNVEHRHVDDHALAFRPDDPDYFLIGTDGGLYESFDGAANWRFISNLPITQFYKVAVDDAEPFYTVYGGTQDNNTQGGPSRTLNVNGIRNADWFITLFADGHQPATEPGNPDIMYSEWQQGNLVRVDRTTGEIVHIQPQPEAGEPEERFNWDAPILVSPHAPTRLYFASHRVWRSDDRGDSWRTVSGDLTRNQERITLPIMDRTWSWDSPWDFLAMSEYNTITSLAESPVQEGMLYAGTDDGLIQASEDGGATWRSIEVGRLPGVPATAFVNDIKADLFDAATVYVALDNHKYGDFRPYLLKSTDRGRTWSSITNSLPERTLVWRVVQDHVDPNLLFAGTEFGVYFTRDGGRQWIQLKGGVPPIPFRDLAIQRRENDLVGATFGRGFYVLDDYSVLRDATPERLAAPGSLFPVRRAWWYVEERPLGGDEKASQGANYFTAPNPPFGAVFTYHLAEGLKTAKAERQERERALGEDEDVPFPGWDAVEAEERQREPMIWLTVRDADGTVVRRVAGETSKGFHRTAWNLRYPAVNAIAAGSSPPAQEPQGVLAAPGEYTVTLSKEEDGVVTVLDGPVPFQVERLRQGALPGASPEEAVAFLREVQALQREVSAASLRLSNALEKVETYAWALRRTQAAPGDLDQQVHDLRTALLDVRMRLSGSQAKAELGETEPPTIASRLSTTQFGVGYSTYGPTTTHRRNLEIAATAFAEVQSTINDLLGPRLAALESALRAAGAPVVD